MKKTYIIPAQEVMTTTPHSMIALSIVTDKKADAESEVLTKEGEWDIWEEEK